MALSLTNLVVLDFRPGWLPPVRHPTVSLATRRRVAPGHMFSPSNASTLPGYVQGPLPQCFGVLDQNRCLWWWAPSETVAQLFRRPQGGKSPTKVSSPKWLQLLYCLWICFVLYVFMYVCSRMDGWMDGWMGGWMYGWMAGWMDGWMDVYMDGWMDGCMDVWMYRCMDV